MIISEGQSEIREMLAALIAENRKLKLDGAQQLGGLIKSVHDVISQLQAETKHRIQTPQAELQTVQGLTSDVTTAMTRSWEDMKKLSNDISSLANEVRFSASNQMLLKSLWFDYMPRRQATVESAHEQTFEWVLDPSSPVEFDKWAQSQNGIYWIMGKAGSGKSTLIKFLLNHPRAIESLKSWAGTKELVIASFFFWNAGSSLQKSQEGLFRSLLCEVLSQCPDLIRTVCASKAETFRPFVGEVGPWTREELWHAIGQLKEQSGVRARFCFFIDGLDEYDGDANHIVNVLENLRSWQDVKLCISSRPWNEFADAFGRPSDPQLALEDLTREDIRKYVRDTLEENPRFRSLRARDDRSQALVQEIVDKARGVFLWVRLVVRSLLTGLTNADRILDLQRRLREFPETLEKYFGQMIASIEPIYREQTAQLFKYALEAERPPSLMMYSFLDEEDLDSVVAAPVKTLSLQEIISRQDDMRRRLNARCKGLLEVVSDKSPQKAYADVTYHVFYGDRVEFHHRTVRDFLLTKDMQNMLAEHLDANFEPKLRFCKALLAQIKASDYRTDFPYSLLDDLAGYASQLESETHVPQTDILDEARQCLSQYMGLRGRTYSENDFLNYLLHKGLYLYFSEKLTKETQMSHLDKSALLGTLLDTTITGYFSRFDVQMVNILLKHGAQPNDKYEDSTVWGYFLRTALLAHEIGMDDELQMTIESLLSHGANLQQRIVIGQKTQTRKMTRRSADLHKREESLIDIIKTAQELLLEKCGEQKTSEMLQNARKDNRSDAPKKKRSAGRSLRSFLRDLMK